jgi:5'-nucleotidase
MIRIPARARPRLAAVTLGTVGAVALGMFAAAPASAADDPVEIDVVTINDFHGRIEADGAAAGAAALATAVSQVREANPNTIFAAAGDLIGASTFTSFIQDDNPTIDALNAAGLEVSATGNHEYDKGWADLRDHVLPRADWEYINANVVRSSTGEPALAPSWVKEVDGVRVGFIGAVTEALGSLVSPDGIADFDVRDIAESVNAAADDLKDGDDANGEADVIILLVHEGAETTDVSSITPDSPLGEIVYGVDDDVDAIVSAHTHLAYNHVIDGRPVVSAGKYGENFGLMTIDVDPTTKQLVSISNEIKPLTDDGAPLYAPDPDVQKIVDDAVTAAEGPGNEQVGSITADFNRARQSDGAENRGGESTLGNFVADVQQWSTGADLALMNPGGLRKDLTYASSSDIDPDGNVTYREAATVQPFANTMMTTTLTGAQLKQVLEEQWQPAGASRPFLKLGVSASLAYTYDPTAAAGEHITSITVGGDPVAPEDTYTVAVNSFLAAGGDNFTTLADGAGTADTGKVDLQSMVDWFSENGTASPDLAQRAVGVVLSAPDADGYSAGDTVTAKLSSLAFSGGEAMPDDVSVSLGDTELASAPIDPTIVDTTDEVGRADVTFTIPEGVDGAQQLTVAVASTGTSVQVPIEVTAPAFEGAIALRSSRVAAGGSLIVRGSGFDAGETLTATLRSKKGGDISLGTITARDDGTVRAALTVPRSTHPGVYTLAVSQADGDTATATAQVNRGHGHGHGHGGGHGPGAGHGHGHGGGHGPGAGHGHGHGPGHGHGACHAVMR